MSDGGPKFLELRDLSLLLFGGKGGVGKTTCAAAAALELARRRPGQAFLIASTDPACSLADCFAGSPLPDNLEMLEIDAAECLQKFKETHGVHLQTIALRGTFLDNEDVARVFDLSLPGLDEVMAFREISALVARGAYSCIIVDTAPTGHTLRFLDLFTVMRQWLDALDRLLAKHRYLMELYRGAYKEDATDAFLRGLQASVEQVASLLRDPHRCRFVPVMLAEALSIQQTHELLVQLQKRGVSVSDILVNRVRPAQSTCPVCREIRRCQDRELRAAAESFTRYSIWEVPLQEAEVRGTERLDRLWKQISLLSVGDETSASGMVIAPQVADPALLPDPRVRLLLFAGKGGVGKTTLACATAFRLAQEFAHRRILLLSTDPAHSLGNCLQVTVGSCETALGRNLTALELDASAEFECLKKEYLGEVRRIFSALTRHTAVDVKFDRDVVERLLDLAPPGLDEVMSITRTVDLLGSRRYDLILVDTAPSGHLIRLLQLPDQVQGWLKILFTLFLKYRKLFWLPRINEFLLNLSKGIKRLKALLADPIQGRLHAVSILREMALTKTRQLLAACQQTGVGVPVLFLNLVTLPGNCPLCSAQAKEEAALRRCFAEAFPSIPQTLIYRGTEPLGQASLMELGQALYRR